MTEGKYKGVKVGTLNDLNLGKNAATMYYKDGYIYHVKDNENITLKDSGIITYIGNVNEDVIKSINEIKEITKKSNLYYHFINLDYKRYENTINAGNNINKYIQTNKKSNTKKI